MVIHHKHHHLAANDATLHPHAWEVISGFALDETKESRAEEGCVLKPVALALNPFGIPDSLLCEMSDAVNAAGEELRSDCPDGSLDCVMVRVLISAHSLRGQMESQQTWRFFINKQLASSESDNLAGPYATIDLHIYQQQ